MAKDFLEEMMDELNELHLQEVQRLHDAVENRERPPFIMTPAAIMRTMYRVALNHKITGDELLQVMGSQPLSAEEAMVLTKAAFQLEEEENR